MKIITKIMQIIIDIIIVFMLVLLFVVLINFFKIIIYNNKNSNLFGFTFFEVSTGSMSKAIEIDDVIIVRITKDVKTGDIISFLNGDEIVTHRIIEEKNNQIITKKCTENGSNMAMPAQAICL